MSGSFGPGRESSSYGGSKEYGGGQHNNAGSRSGGGNQGSGSFQGGGPNPLTRDKMRTQDQMGAMVSKALDDYNGVGDSFIDKIGNMLARGFGFNEMNPSLPGFGNPGMPGITGKANWGFDPAVGIAGALGMGFGFPGTGLVADQLSQWAGRPLEINMGPDVFGSGGPARPQSVQTAAGGPGGGGVPPQGGGTGNGGRGGVPHSTGNPNLPIPKPGSPQASGLVPMPGKPPAPAAIQSIPYANAIPMPGQVKLPANYFMSQVA